MAQVLVVYPSGPSFDLDYYLKTHMPLVSSYVPFIRIPPEYLKTTTDTEQHLGILRSSRLGCPYVPRRCAVPGAGYFEMEELGRFQCRGCW